MTGPRVEAPQKPKPHPLSPEAYDAARPSGITRGLSPDEYDQAQGMTPTQLRQWRLPPITDAIKFAPGVRGRMGALADGMSAAPSDMTRTGPERTKGKKLAEFDIKDPTTYLNPVLRQLINPALDNPFSTAAMLAGAPAVAAGVASAAGGLGASAAMGKVLGDIAVMSPMIHSIASYGWQKAAEMTLHPEDRKRAEEDPDRVSGEAAVVQAIGLGLGALAHVGVASKGLRLVGPAKNMEIRAKSGQLASAVRQGPNFLPGDVSGMELPTGTNRFSSDLRMNLGEGADAARVGGVDNPPGFQPSGTVVNSATVRGKAAVKTAPNNPFNSIPSEIKVKPTATEPASAPLQDAADLSAAVTPDPEALAKIEAMKPRRRAQPATNFFESETGAETLGAAAGRHGLPEEANPYHPDSPKAAIWREAHQAAVESFPAGEFPEGFSMGGALADSRIPPDYSPPKTPGFEPTALPEGVTPETLALSEALKPSPYRGHSIDELANEVIATQKAITSAQKAIERNATSDHVKFEDPVTAERGEVLFEDRGREAHEWPEAEVHKKAIKSGMTRLAKLERELAMRGVSGDELADVMKGANERHLEREGMQQEESLARGTGEPAPVTEPVAAESGSARGLAPVEGTGETFTRGTARSIEARAIMNGLVTRLDHLPEARSVNFTDQGLAAADFLARDPELARAIAMGDASPPHGLLREAVAIAVENKATAEGDVATIDALTQGRRVTDRTTMAQELGYGRMRNAESAVDALDEIAATATKGKDVPKMTAAEVASMEKHMTKVDVAWKKFVDQLRCS